MFRSGSDINPSHISYWGPTAKPSFLHEDGALMIAIARRETIIRPHRSISIKITIPGRLRRQKPAPRSSIGAVIEAAFIP